MRVFCVMVVVGMTLAGCNTVAGMGEDISGAARWVQGVLPGGGY